MRCWVLCLCKRPAAKLKWTCMKQVFQVHFNMLPKRAVFRVFILFTCFQGVIFSIRRLKPKHDLCRGLCQDNLGFRLIPINGTPRHIWGLSCIGNKCGLLDPVTFTASIFMTNAAVRSAIDDLYKNDCKSKTKTRIWTYFVYYSHAQKDNV